MILKWTPLLLATLAIASCGGSSDNSSEEMDQNTPPEFASHTCDEPGLLSDVFQVNTSAECFNGEPPAAVGTITLDATKSLVPALQSIQGGSQALEMSADSPYFEIYVSEPGRYFKFTKAGNSGGDVLYVGFQTTIEDDVRPSVDVQVATAEGVISEPISVPFEPVEIGTGELQVSLTWSNAAYNLDLELLTPDGSTINASNPTGTSGGTFDLASNDNCVIDDLQDENIYFEPGTAQNGAYQLRVTNTSKCGSVSNFALFVVTVRSENGIERIYGSLDLESEMALDGFTLTDGTVTQ